MKERRFFIFFHLPPHSQIISLLFSLVVYNLLASGQGGGWKSITSSRYYETTIFAIGSLLMRATQTPRSHQFVFCLKKKKIVSLTPVGFPRGFRLHTKKKEKNISIFLVFTSRTCLIKDFSFIDLPDGMKKRSLCVRF